jgi:hypothetical protein
VTTHELVAGDVNVVVPVQLETADGPVDVSAATIVVHVKWRDGEAVTSYDGNITDGPAGKFVFVVPLVPAGPLHSRAEYKISWPDPARLTWPSRRTDAVVVRAELA